MRKRKTSPWLLLVGFAAIIAFFLVLWPEKDQQGQLDRYKLEKTGAGTSADYTAACTVLHTTVDTVLSNHRVIIKQTEAIERQAPRTQAEGKIRWHSRNLLIEKPKDLPVHALIKSLEAALPQAKGKILAIQSDDFQGTKTQRLDIGLQDMLDQDPVTIISDKIFIITEPSEQKKLQVKAEMAIIIDDFGYSAEPIQSFVAIKQPLTFSVLPHRPFSNESAANALSAGHQVMLHLPMEPLAPANVREPVVISAAMNDKQIRETVLKALASVPGAVGVNNHQGSKATADNKVMRAVMAAISPNNLFFVDSRTTSESVAAAIAKQSRIRTAENDLFIDNNPDVGAIKAQIRQAIKTALKQNEMIIIGHARPTTAIALREMLPEIEASGIRLVFASQLVK
ncbi:hypothetical protein AXX12_03640 [Anaerosporomusa subterranea]|uniref:Divergent polysaccharide deacetylase n=1 Tax=Anaerosporomusa subterranea TaxID=1794912 RepID=A0A154BTE0_ANASB|nr:divergent polysaccharide deacetylase family protein [Anaerosporomusa subterranea]KYZ77236.1 hypothetical protein AXX12_03640 [Anaerosporomusa subterranea]